MTIGIDRLDVWYVEEVCWDLDHTNGQRTILLVEARSCAEAAQLAGEGDGIHEIEIIRRMGPIVARPLPAPPEVEPEEKGDREVPDEAT